MIAVNLIFDRPHGTTVILRPCKRHGCSRWAVVSRWNRKKVFCAEPCRDKYHNTDGLRARRYGSVDPEPVPCLLCGRPLDVKKPGRKLFCDRRCIQKYARLQKSGVEPVENCEVCDKKLLPLRERRCDQTVCSPECVLARQQQRYAVRQLRKAAKIRKIVADGIESKLEEV